MIGIVDAVDAEGRKHPRWKRAILSTVIIVAVLALPVALGAYLQGAANRRADLAKTALDLCLDNQADGDTSHSLIEQIGEPSPAGNAITRLYVPPETPEYVRIILTQLAAPLTEEQKAEIRAPYFETQGERPTCKV